MDKRKSSAMSPGRSRKSSTAPARSPSRDKERKQRVSRRVSDSTNSLVSDVSAHSSRSLAKSDKEKNSKDKKLKNILGKERGSLQKKWGTMVGELEDKMGSTDRKESRRKSRSTERKVSRIDNIDGKFDKLKEALSKKRSSSAASSRHGGSESGASEISGRSWQANTPRTRRKSRIVIQSDQQARSRSQSRGDVMRADIALAADHNRSQSQGRLLDSSAYSPDMQRRRSRSQSRIIETNSRMSTPEAPQRSSRSQGGRNSRTSRSDGSDLELHPSRGRSHSRVVDERRVSVMRPSIRSQSQSRVLESSQPRSSLASHRSSSASRLDSISVHSADGRRSSKESQSSKALLKNPKALSINEKHARGDVYRYSRPLNPGEAPMTSKERKKGVKFFKDVKDEAGEIVDEVLGRAVKAVYGKDSKHYTRRKSKSHSDVSNVQSVNNVHDVRRVSNIHDIRRVSNVHGVRKMSNIEPQRRQSQAVTGQERRRSSIRPIAQSGHTRDGKHAPAKSAYRDIDFDIEIGGGGNKHHSGGTQQQQTNISETTYNRYNYTMHSPDSTGAANTLQSVRSDATSHAPGYSTTSSVHSSHITGSLPSSAQSTISRQERSSENAAESSRSGRVNPPTLTRGSVTRVLHELNENRNNAATSTSQTSSEYTTNTWPMKAQSSSSNSTISVSEQSSTLPRISVSESSSVRTAQSTPHILQLTPDNQSQPKIDLVPKNGPLSPHSVDFLIDTNQLKQQQLKEIDHQHFTVYHGELQPSQSKTQSEVNQANALTIQANLPTIREEDEAKYGAYSNEPIIVADLIDNKGIKRPKGEIDSVMMEQTKGRLYGTQPDVAMNRHQVLNFYLFNQPNTGEPKPKLGYVAQEVQMKMGDETEAYANLYVNRDGSERHKREVKEWLAEQQQPKSDGGSEDTELREAYIFHKQTQTMQSPQPSPPRRVRKEMRTAQQVIRRPSPPPSPPKRKHRETTHYITQTREIEKVPPEKELRSMSIQTDAPPLRKARSVVVEAPTMLTSQTTLYEERNRPPTPALVLEDESFDETTTVTTTVPRIIENRQMEQRIEYDEPPVKVVPMHMKQDTHTDIFTLIDRELEPPPPPPKTEIVPVEESESDDETVILEMTEIETREQRVAMAIFEEVEFSYKKTEGGRVIESGSSSDRAEIPPFWLPNRYEAVVDRKKQKMTQVRENTQHGMQSLESGGFPKEHQRHLEGPEALLALDGGNIITENAMSSESNYQENQSMDPRDHVQVIDRRRTESSQHPKQKRVHRSSVHQMVGEEDAQNQQEHQYSNEQFKRDELPPNKVSSLLTQYSHDEKILSNPGMKPATENHGFKPIENDNEENNPKRTSSLKRQSAFRKVQKTVPVPNGDNARKSPHENQKFRSSTQMYVAQSPSENSSQASSGGGVYYNSLSRNRRASGGSSSGMDFVALSPISVPNVDVPNYPNHVDEDDVVEPESLEIFERRTTTKKSSQNKKTAPPPPPPLPPLNLNHSAHEQHQAHVVNQKASRQNQWIDSFMSQTPPPFQHPPSPTKAPSSSNSKIRKSNFDPDNISFGKKTGADMMRESNELSFNLEKINVPSEPSSPTKKHTFEELEGHSVSTKQSEPTMQTKYARDKDGNLVKVTELQHTLTKTVEYESDEEKRRRDSMNNEQLGEGGYIKMAVQQTTETVGQDEEEEESSARQSPRDREYTGPEVVAEMERTLRPYYFESQSQTLDMRGGAGAGVEDQKFLYDMDKSTLKPIGARDREHVLEQYGETMTTEL